MNIHFIGIGGIGISALAQYYLAKGHKISGSDLVSSEITTTLRKRGVKLFIGQHKTKNLPKNVNKVIYSPAVQKDNPELRATFKILQAACCHRRRSRQNSPDRPAVTDGGTGKIQISSYPEDLGKLTKKHFTIAVSGTHGKSTTTAMIGLILIKAGFDPTIIVGTKLKEFTPRFSLKSEGSNCRIGKSKYLVIEADEQFASFLNYWPKIIVLTNIEKEHLDYYKNLHHLLRTFRKYILHLLSNDVLIVNWDDENIRRRLICNSQFPISKQILNSKFQIQKFSLKQKEAKKLKKILKIPGEYNIYNALAALTAARVLKIPDKISFKVLSKYKGCWRRFEISQSYFKYPIFNSVPTDRTFSDRVKRKTIIVSDYAHHPTEIKVTLEAARGKWSRKKIWIIFQPHQYQRTFYLFDDFVKVFSKALQPTRGKVLVDKVILTDIYEVMGREEKKIKEKVSSKKLVEAIKKNTNHKLKTTKDNTILHISTFKKTINYLKKNLQGGEIVVIIGAGDIYKLKEKI